MKLTDYDPRWIIESEGRHGMGLSFDCPHCDKLPPEDRTRIGIWFSNPVDGKEHASEKCRAFTINGVEYIQPLWNRYGDTFENLSLAPSVDASASGHWHGNIINGEIKHVP